MLEKMWEEGNERRDDDSQVSAVDYWVGGWWSYSWGSGEQSEWKRNDGPL